MNPNKQNLHVVSRVGLQGVTSTWRGSEHNPHGLHTLAPIPDQWSFSHGTGPNMLDPHWYPGMHGRHMVSLYENIPCGQNILCEIHPA